MWLLHERLLLQKMIQKGSGPFCTILLSLQAEKRIYQMKRFLIVLWGLLVCACVSARVIYEDRNVSIVVEDGWKILHGERIVAFGDGPMDVNNLPPAFQELLNIYAELPVQQSVMRAQARGGFKSPSVSVEPLITTQWNQGAPYNQAFPTVKGVPTVVGCSTIATAQVLNYYRHCSDLKLEGRNQAYSDLASAYFFNIEKSFDGTYYDYKYDFTPDFDEINADTATLSAFLFGIALAQHAYFDVDGTMTSIYTQRGALDNVFGYDYELYQDANCIEDSMIASLEKLRPLIMSGNNAAAGHSFNIDGYKEGKFHINYGWGGYCDGWYELSECLFQDNLKAVSAYPSDGTRVKMQMIPESVRVVGVDVDYDQTFGMAPPWEGTMSYCPLDLIKLEPGQYTFWFIYPDGSIIAPYLEDFRPLSKMHESVISYGKYISSPALINVDYKCGVNFWHSPEMGYIQILAQDFEDAEFPNYTVSLMLDGQSRPMTLGQSDPILRSVNFNDTLELTPGKHEFLFFIAQNDTTIGKAERCGPAPTNVYYGMEQNTTGWSSTYTDEPINITVPEYAVPDEGDTVRCESIKVMIYLDKYMDAHLLVLDYTGDLPSQLPVIRADESGLMYNLWGLPVERASGIIIRNGKKVLVK